MSPRDQINALMNTVGNQPEDVVAPCKKNKTHTIQLLVRWQDDLTPVNSADFEIYRGKPLYTSDSVVKGKYKEKNVPPGNYKLFFPDIHADEIEEG